ncbi:transposase [Oscillatoria sp. CS-180]|uniref:transposase n=1 Tax=Oscillatoria sp. CS-180 TaxID=3021720 RepID=UPI00232E1682|nr:transposase [Oscillatoria sp. CS-180]MDB9527281.1 transposase [Oscillatoria sp. CS-180]
MSFEFRYFRAFEVKSGSDALVDLLDWMVTAQSLYPNSVATMRQWFGEILQYFEHRTTSGVVEVLQALGHTTWQTLATEK